MKRLPMLSIMPLSLACVFAQAEINVVFAQTSAAKLITRAGNAEDEQERFRILEELANLPDLEPELRGDLEKLLPFVDRWANGREKYWKPVLSNQSAENGYLASFMFSIFRQQDPVTQIKEDSPLYPIWCMYLGRIQIQIPIQVGRLARDAEGRGRFFGEGRRLLGIARDHFPKNRIIRMYLDEPIPWDPIHAPDPQAPDWADHQRECLEKLGDIISFWINERQAPDGQFGGGWGDDVEMWRNWTSILIGFDDPAVNAAQTRLSTGLFSQPRMAGGYTNVMSDVEHTAEDSGDAGTALMHLNPDDPMAKTRALRLAELMEKLWTGRNERGLLQFKSAYFTSDEVDDSAARACDTLYHPRAIQPALLYWQRSADPQLTRLFSDWMDTWVDAAAREERGKPAGILPTAIHWPEGTIGGVGENWWQPEIMGPSGPFEWPSHMQQMTSTLLLTAQMTGDQKYFEPIHSMAVMRMRELKRPTPNPAPGSAAWCAQNVKGNLSQTLSKYRLLSDDSQYDELLMADAGAYVRYRLSGDRKLLQDALKTSALNFRHNREAYCSEVRWTDRVFKYHSKYAEYYTKPPLGTPNLGLLYSTVTGDFGNPLYFPLNAVRWKTPARDIAALVTDHSTNHLSAELFHFGDERRSMSAEFYSMQPGQYELTISAESSGHVFKQSRTFNISGPRAVVPFELPSRQLCQLHLRLIGK